MNNPDNFNDLKRHLRIDDQRWQTDAAWSRMQRRMRPARGRLRWLAAALVILGLGLGVLARLQRGPGLVGTVQLTQHVTGVGERKVIQLADGSTVELAPQSRLYLFKEKDERSVQLDGEAFFNVRRDPQHPFRVHARGVEVRVLGTSFDVAAYTGENIRVGVVTGRVRVQQTLVNPGQVATVAGDSVLVEAADTGTLSPWRSGRLSFRDVTFSEAASAIERWHNVDIVIADSTLARARVSATFTIQSLAEIIELLSETLDAQFTRTGNRITYRPK
jgi:transmembrane sensor